MAPWLVRVEVNPRCHRVWSRGMLDGRALHRDVMRLAPEALGSRPRKAADVLFRAEQSPSGLRILAQLTTPPRADNLDPEFAVSAQTRDVGDMLASVSAGTRLRYRIDANPTKRLGNSAGDRKGQLVALHHADAENWWHRRAAESGLELLSTIAQIMPDILGSRTRDRDRREYVTRHAVTRFEGVAVVVDPERVRAAVTDGIGRARSYGCGLLSVAPMSGGEQR